MGDELKQAAQEIVDHVGPERLARNYNLTSMEIPGDMLRRLALALGGTVTLGAVRAQVHRRLSDEVGIHATEAEVAAWSVVQVKDAMLWMVRLLRRME